LDQWRQTGDEKLMAWHRDIPAEREANGVRTCVARVWDIALPEVLKDLGLTPNAEDLVEVGPTEAVAILAILLHRDLAYRAEVMPKNRAEGLAAAFVAEVGGSASRFYSNMRQKELEAGNFPKTSFTDATFDAGIVALSPPLAACVWIKDED
jgi:hypothetical protein